MGNLASGSYAALSTVQGCLFVSVQADLYDDVLAGIREQVLARVYAKSVRGVVFDMSTVRVMDSHTFCHFAETAKMSLVLGVRAVFVGFQAGVVSALVDMDVDTTTVSPFRTCEDALGYLLAALCADKGSDDVDDIEASRHDADDSRN